MRKIKPHKYQKKIINFMVEREAAGIFATPGLGKTLCTLLALKKLKDDGKIDKILIVAKMRICHLVWPKEIKKWGFSFTYSVLQGSKKNKLFDDNSDIHLVSYESIRWLMPKLVGKNRNKYSVCVLDESSKIKNFAAKRSKMLHILSERFAYRYLLTGSPTPRSLLDIFSQIKFLDFGYRLGKYITHFRNEYFYPSGYKGYDWLPFEDTDKRIASILKDIVLRIDSDEAGLELPEENATIRRVELPDKIRRLYKDMEKDFIIKIENKEITASTAAVASGKLRQVANGGIYDADKNTTQLHDEKTEELVEIIEELQGSPVLVAYWYDHDLKRLQKALPSAKYIGAGISTKESIKIESDWNAGKLSVLLGQPASIAHGLNLQDGGCHTVIFYSLPDNLEDYEQFIQRVLRQGNKNKFVNVIHIVAEDTVDEDIIVGLYAKDKTQQTFLNHLQDRLNVTFDGVNTKEMNKYEILVKHVNKPQGKIFSGKELPKNENWNEIDKMFIDNFVTGIKNSIGGWLPKNHVAFLKDMGVKNMKDSLELSELYRRSSLMIQEILGASRESGERFYKLEDNNVIYIILKLYRGKKEMVKESRIADVIEGESENLTGKEVAENTAKIEKKKSTAKKSTAKKSTAKKSTAKKSTAKKPVGRKPKTELNYKPNNIVKVTSDEFPRAEFRANCLKIIRRTRTKKVGYLVNTLQEKLGVTELRAFKAMEGLRDKGFISFK